jgi:Sec-independent protein translocase protein TatA
VAGTLVHLLLVVAVAVFLMAPRRRPRAGTG